MTASPLPSPAPTLDESYAHCAEVTRRRARNFYYGLRLTPEQRRSAIYAVYAWMRRADDEADAADNPAAKLHRLDAFRALTERLMRGQSLGDAASLPLWIAFGDTVRRYGLDPSHLRSMLEGLQADIEHEARAASRPAGVPEVICRSREDLEAYCYRVASTVGLVCIRIWGLKPGADEDVARRLAIQRGLAFQLTNVLRDFAPDFEERRLYLPANDLREAGLSPADLRFWRHPAACERLVVRLSAWARAQYDASAPLDRMIDPACYAALRTMTRIYSGLLRVIEHDPSRIVGRRRIRLQSVHKAGIALRAYARAWVNQHVPVTSPLYAVLTPVSRR
jgi:phytoene synthase